MAKNIIEFNIDGTSYTQRPYCTCSTAADTAAKVVTCADFNLVAGATVMVQFTNANTVDNPTLNVNNTGAKPIFYRGTRLSSFTFNWNWDAYDIIEFRYNGSRWDILNISNAKTATSLYKSEMITSSSSTNKDKWIKFATVDVSASGYNRCSGHLIFSDNENGNFFGILGLFITTTATISDESVSLRWISLDNILFKDSVAVVKVNDGIFDLYFKAVAHWLSPQVYYHGAHPEKITFNCGDASTYVDNITPLKVSSIDSQASNSDNALKLNGLDSSLYFKGTGVLESDDFNNKTTLGLYRYNGITGKNGPADADPYGNLMVLRSGTNDTLTQLYFNIYNNRIFARSGSVSQFINNDWNKLAFTSDIPTSLKNPNKLTLKVGNNTPIEYDGSSAKTVNIDFAHKQEFTIGANKYAKITGGGIFTAFISVGSTIGNARHMSCWSSYGSGQSLRTNIKHIINGTDIYIDESDTGPIIYIKGYSQQTVIHILCSLSSFTCEELSSLPANVSITNTNSNNYTLAVKSDIPTSLKNPYSLTIQGNGTSLGTYNGSSAKTVNITPSSIGALALTGGTLTGPLTISNNSLNITNEKPVVFTIPRCNENGGGWAVKQLIVNGHEDSGGNYPTIYSMGSYGQNNALNYIFIGANEYNSTKNLRIYPDGKVEAPTFNGDLIGNVTGNVTGNVNGNVNGNASTATKLGSGGKIWLYPENGNEVNFGGTSADSTVYFGYRAKDSKPIPTLFIFGSSTGTAQIKAAGFIKKDSTNSYVLLGGGGHKAISDFATASKLGSSTIGATDRPIYLSSGSPKQCSALADTLITYESVYNDYDAAAKLSPIQLSASNYHSANRLAFANPDGITIEYSTDGGTTWVDYGLSNIDKFRFITHVDGIYIYAGKKLSAKASKNDKLRITLHASNLGLYTRATNLLVNMSTNGSVCNKSDGGVDNCIKVDIERSNIGSESNFTSTASNIRLAGWSGWNNIPMNQISFGGGSNQTSNIGAIRLTFYSDGAGSSYSSGAHFYIQNLYLIGSTYWASPSTLAKTGNLYDYNYLQDMILPKDLVPRTHNTGQIGWGDKQWAAIYANGFYENGTQLVNKYAAKEHTHTKSQITDFPTIGNGTITIKQNGTSKGTFTVNQTGNTTIELTDTTGITSQDHYKTSVAAGTAGTSSATSGSTLAVPYVTVNANGHVTGYGTHTHTISGFLTSHQPIYNLTMQAGAFSAATFDPNGAAKTVNIPTKTSHLTNDSGFLTSETYKGTVTKVSTGVGLTGGDITSTGTIKCKLNSETSLGTIGTTSKLYAVGVDANGKLCVNVPWTDTNTDTSTTYGGHYTPSGTAKTGTASGNTLSYGGAVVTGLTYDGKGHVTGFATSKLPSAITVDTSLSSTSTNPVQNKVINSALNNKMDKVTLATVATTGSYNDLTNKPTIPAAVTSLPWSKITGKPTFATVATTGSYNDLTNKPTIPTIPSSLPSNGIINAYTTNGITSPAISVSGAIRFDTMVCTQYLGNTNKFTGCNNAILSISRFENNQYTTQLGFSGNGIYARIFNGKTPDTSTSWKTMIMDDGAGNVTAKAFYISSDERLKTFGDDIKVDFDELAKLRKSHFIFNDNPTKQEIGVSAQEVQKIYPEIVNETEEGTLSVDYSKLAVVALAAIDKLNQRVQELENKLAKYE